MQRLPVLTPIVLLHDLHQPRPIVGIRLTNLFLDHKFVNRRALQWIDILHSLQITLPSSPTAVAIIPSFTALMGRGAVMAVVVIGRGGGIAKVSAAGAVG